VADCEDHDLLASEDPVDDPVGGLQDLAKVLSVELRHDAAAERRIGQRLGRVEGTLQPALGGTRFVPSSTPPNRNCLIKGALRPRDQGLAPGYGSRG
jgi:hypothetical protein